MYLYFGIQYIGRFYTHLLKEHIKTNDFYSFVLCDKYDSFYVISYTIHTHTN